MKTWYEEVQTIEVQTWKFKPFNLYGSKWLQRIENSSDPPKVESPVMRNDKPIEDVAKYLISEEMARSSPMFNQNLETPGCLRKLYTGYEKADLNQLNSECIVNTTTCQTPRECQTRSYATLKGKSSMIQRSTPNASAKQLYTELDLPQSGSGDDDETWFTELTGIKNTTTTEAVSESDMPADKHLNSVEAFHQHPRTRSAAEPDLPRTPSDHVKERDLPGPLSRDDDEDSSPYVQDLDSADHVPCSSSTMTTSGHNDKTLTHSLGASAHGSEFPIAPNANLTGSDRKVTPVSPELPAASQKWSAQTAKLTIFLTPRFFVRRKKTIRIKTTQQCKQSTTNKFSNFRCKMKSLTEIYSHSQRM